LTQTSPNRPTFEFYEHLSKGGWQGSAALISKHCSVRVGAALGIGLYPSGTPSSPNAKDQKMKLKTLTAVAVLALCAASSALAATTLTATLPAPATKARVIAGGAVWACEGTVCVATAAPDNVASTKSCKDLAKAVGPVVGYASASFSLDAENLAKCNLSARPAAH